VQYWWFGSYFRTVCHSPADSPRRPRGQSARCLRTVRLVLRRVAKSFDTWVSLLLWDCLGFVPRDGRSVGRLHDLGKLVWESLVVNLGHRPSSLFWEEFLSAPIHSPLSSSLIGPSDISQVHAHGTQAASAHVGAVRRAAVKPDGYIIGQPGASWRRRVTNRSISDTYNKGDASAQTRLWIH
jgi:hypothetical protein